MSDSMSFNLGFQTKYILNPWSMDINPVKVSFYVFVILSKNLSAHCAKCRYLHAEWNYTLLKIEHLPTGRCCKTWLRPNSQSEISELSASEWCITWSPLFWLVIMPSQRENKGLKLQTFKDEDLHTIIAHPSPTPIMTFWKNNLG